MLRNLFVSDVSARAMLRSGLPGPENPSDHIPIGAVFDWTGATPATQPPSLAGLCSAGRGGGGPTAISSEDPLGDAAALLEACPCTPDQLLQFATATTEPGWILARSEPGGAKRLVTALSMRTTHTRSSRSCTMFCVATHTAVFCVPTHCSVVHEHALC
jgi:hypothetical protein